MVKYESSLGYKIGSISCCGKMEISCLPWDNAHFNNANFEEKQIKEFLRKDLRRIKAIAEEYGQTFLVATTNENQTIAAEFLREEGFESTPEFFKHPTKGTGFIQMHYLQLTKKYEQKANKEDR